MSIAVPKAARERDPRPARFSRDRCPIDALNSAANFWQFPVGPDKSGR